SRKRPTTAPAEPRPMNDASTATRSPAPAAAHPARHERILILDFGSQVTQLIARRLRESHVYCEIHPNDVDDAFVRGFGAKGVILSGSHASVYDAGAGRVPP